MNKNVYLILLFWTLLFSCSTYFENNSFVVEKNNLIKNDNLNLEKNIQKKQNIIIKKEEEDLWELNWVWVENSINEKILDKSLVTKDKNIQKLLDIKFYSQFPTRDFWLPFDEFCEEASLLNWIYYFNDIKPSIEKYLYDLFLMKEIEDKIFWNNWYVSTSIEQTNLILQLFQNPEYVETYLNLESLQEKEELIDFLVKKSMEEWKIFWKILYNPSISDFEESINNWNPVIISVYWRGLNNIYFTPPWPIHHVILLKWYDENNFIFNEVWTVRWESYYYNKDLIMKNIYDYDKELYPEKFKLWDSKALILYKQ